LWAQQLQQRVSSLRALDDERDFWRQLPVVRAEDLGIPSDAERDATDDLQRALDGLRGGGTLLLGPGVYVHSRCLELNHPRTRLVGDNARLHARNPLDMCVALKGNDTEIRNLELSANFAKRESAPKQARILVSGTGNRVVGNRVAGATAAGIWVHGAKDFAVTHNHVTATLSDGIHSSDGATRGYVAHNHTNLTGDDGIAVVSYRKGLKSSVVLIEHNRVSDVSWARGIAVVGSSEIVVSDNVVDGTGRAAGIIVTREESFDTYGVEQVIVERNVVRNVARRFKRAPNDMTGQGAIDLNVHSAPTPDLRVRQVLLDRNTVEDSAGDGIRILGAVCGVSVIRNTIKGVAGAAIATVEPSCKTIEKCAANVVAGSARVPPACKSSGALIR
jgi:hypothetical protein